MPFHRSLALLAAIAACAWASPAPAAAQGSDAPISLEVTGSESEVQARLGPILESSGIRGSLESGLPVRIRVVVELWRERFIDAQEGRWEWRGSVWQDPLGDGLRVETANGAARTAGTPEQATRMLSEDLEVPLGPTRPGRYYYLARIEVETLSLSDLEELRRWLQGDLGPAVEGEGGVGSAVGRGLQRLLVRVLGLPAERFQARSRSFRYPG